MAGVVVEIIGGLLALVVVVTLCVRACDNETARRTQDELHAPLMHKDAETGFNTCRICDFENFKRIPFCSLCGEKLVANDSNSDAAMAVPTESERLNLSHRQKRARSRKEWARKVDVQGRLFWYRQGRGRALRLAMRQSPGYTLAFVDDTKVNEDSGTKQEPKLTVASKTSSRYPLIDNQDASLTKVVIEIFLPDTSPSNPDASVPPEPAATIPLDAASEDPSLLPSTLAKDDVVQNLQLEAMFQVPVLTESSVGKASRKPYAFFVSNTTKLIVDVTKEYVKLNVHRDKLLEDSLEALSVIPQDHIHSMMRVILAKGVDAGGLQREWFLLLNEALADPSNDVFCCVNASEQVFYLNPHSRDDIGEAHLLYYYTTGRLVGRALLEGQVLGFHLALPLLKIILGIPVSFPDLESFDPEAYKSLLWIRDNTGVGDLGIGFVVAEARGSDNEMVMIDLIEDGRNIEVNDENKDLYLERRFRYLLFESVSSQLYCFLKGLYEVVPFHLLAVFDPEELDFVLCGSDVIDVDEWKRCTRMNASLRKHDKAVTWFWELVREMPNEYRRRLLNFATGSSRVPLGGFRALTSSDGRLCPFTLKGVKFTDSNACIASRACFNQLDIPLYESKAQMKTILMGILDTELHGFTKD
uniref:HECT-type E3 ubiquitin transferase n=1 Tax=Globisporangium ultimum (strain ATCC 200006 / CBS 805.95 / DAOM BR144) TaxID=431595 RepID=K3X479_GLOUD